MPYWLAIGSPGNWAFCINNSNIWGFATSHEKHWESIAKGDTIICYATRPVKRIIGYCTVSSKKKDERPFFPGEMNEYKSLWPLRLTLTPSIFIPEERWATSSLSIERHWGSLQRALQRLDESMAEKIIREIHTVYGK